MRSKIRIAIAGVGNCASSLVQGIYYYTHNDVGDGLRYRDIGGYKVSDIKVIAAFDIDKRKVGKDLSKAIFSEPNNTKKIINVPSTGITVNKGPILDGVAKHMNDVFLVDNSQKTSDVVKVLRESKAEMLICYLPVGSAKAARFYAQTTLTAKVGFINAIPEFICSDAMWIRRFKSNRLPCAGDDIKSQVGATILHRVIARLIQDRGHTIENTYQLNIGGNTDFLNMLDESRLSSKRISKTRAVTSILEKADSVQVRIGPCDFVPHLKDNKVCYINIKGRQFAGVPFELDLKLSVEDSPNSAGVMVDVIRCMKLALNRGISGNLEEISAYAFKSPRVQYRDDVARQKLDTFIKGGLLNFLMKKTNQTPL